MRFPPGLPASFWSLYPKSTEQLFLLQSCAGQGFICLSLIFLRLTHREHPKSTSNPAPKDAVWPWQGQPGSWVCSECPFTVSLPWSWNWLLSEWLWGAFMAQQHLLACFCPCAEPRRSSCSAPPVHGVRRTLSQPTEFTRAEFSAPTPELGPVWGSATEISA